MKHWKYIFLLVIGLTAVSLQQNINDSSQTCECIPYYLCRVNGTVIEYGEGIIDVRSGISGSGEKDCSHYLDICCKPPNIVKNKPGQDTKPKDQSTGPTLVQSTGKGCGLRNPNGLGYLLMGNYSREAQFGEFPWMTAIFREEEEINGARVNIYTCGGSLIHPKVVLTSAHCVSGIDASRLMIRVGEWDTRTTKEPLPVQDRSVASVIMHSKFSVNTLTYNVALLILTDPVNYADNVDIVCLPDVHNYVNTGSCVVTGWGNNLNQYQPVLKKIEVSLITFNACEQTIRQNALFGWNFNLDRTSICGTENNGVKACKGDVGSPLVCPLRAYPGRYGQVGIVSWGAGCKHDLPGVYASVQVIRTWIEQQLLLNKITQ